MELRSAEQEVQELQALYQQLVEQISITTESTMASSTSSATPSTPTKNSSTNEVPWTDLLDKLRCIPNRLQTLDTKVQRFIQRSKEQDPVTGQSRYGTQTQQRVQALVQQYQQVLDTLTLDNTLQSLEAKIQEQIQQEQRLAEQAQQAHLEEQRQLELALQQEQQRRLEQEQRQLQQQEEERALQYQLVQERIRQQEREQQQARQAQLDWLQSIPRGSMQVQLNKLLESTQQDQKAQTTALQALHTLFSQIVAHPEDANLRRIRRNHSQFVQDIGRHYGGTEMLIAAGFTLGVVEDVSCLLLQEPNIETDMDAWSEWYELLQKTVELLAKYL